MTHVRISHYELLERLGAGGMGVVYKARDTKLERFVSVKLLRPELVADAERVQRFLQEAKTASGLNHPSITTIHQLGESEGRHFITMEFVDGENLRDRLRRGPLEVRQILDLGAHVAEGLAVAHTAGIVHRDLKPENIMLRPDGLVKILDFGLAKLLENDDRGGSRLASALASDDTLVQPVLGSPGVSSGGSDPTLPGLVMGTVGYMSPEQVRGERVDARSDIFALGAVLYELSTGLKPFGTGAPIEVMHAILKEQPQPLHLLRPEMPVEFERILRKAMAKDAEERYQSAKEMAIDLRALRREIDSGALVAAYAAPSGPVLRLAARRGGLVVGIVVIGVLAASVHGVVGAQPGAPARNTAAAGHSPHRDRPGVLTGHLSRRAARRVRCRGCRHAVHLAAPAGNRQRSAADRPRRQRSRRPRLLARRQLALLPVLATGHGGAHAVSRAHLGRHATARCTRTWIRRSRSRPTASASSSPGWCLPFGGIILLGDAEGTSEPQLVAERAGVEFMFPQWSPDGKRIAVTERSVNSPLSWELALLPAAGGDAVRLRGASWSDVAQLCWEANGNAVLVSALEQGQGSSFQLYAVDVHDGTTRQLTTDLSGYRGVSRSADGRTW